MSTQENYKNVRIVLFERDSDVRQAIKSTLSQETFENILATSGLKTAQASIFNDSADLVLVDIDHDRKSICTMMQKIRQNEIGDNPFPVSIAISGNSDYVNVRQTFNAGFDILLLKPFSMSTLTQRIYQLMKGRSPFNITSDYIGPDRRQVSPTKRNQRPVTLVTVPNPLKIRANGEITNVQFQRLIKESIVEVNDQRVLCHGEKIGDLVGSLVSKYMLEGLDEDFSAELKRLKFICADMDHRLRRSKFAHVAELGSTLLSVVDRILECPMSPESRDIDLMQNLSSAISRAFMANEKDVKAAHSISSTVRAIA
ncbi:MAG: response regulator transcription factor [Rhodospirillales bacterium]|nr:response regulator transcription factor [Rhodospirillales bacterium]